MQKLAIYFSPFEVRIRKPKIIVDEGQSVTLMCQVNRNGTRNPNWKNCRWTRLKDGKYCLYEWEKPYGDNDWDMQPLCDASMEDYTFQGTTNWKQGLDNDICGIEIISADYRDQSEWKCELDQCQGDYDKKDECESESGNSAAVTVNVTVIT